MYRTSWVTLRRSRRKKDPAVQFAVLTPFFASLDTGHIIMVKAHLSMKVICAQQYFVGQVVTRVFASVGVIARGTFRVLLADHGDAIRQRHSVSQSMAWPLLPAFVKQPPPPEKPEVTSEPISHDPGTKLPSMQTKIEIRDMAQKPIYSFKPLEFGPILKQKLLAPGKNQHGPRA